MASHTQIGLDNVTAKDSFLKSTYFITMAFSRIILISNPGADNNPG